MPLINQNQMLRCLPIGMMSTFALTIWLYLIPSIFLYVSLQVNEKNDKKNIQKEQQSKALKYLYITTYK